MCEGREVICCFFHVSTLYLCISMTWDVLSCYYSLQCHSRTCSPKAFVCPVHYYCTWSNTFLPCIIQHDSRRWASPLIHLAQLGLPTCLLVSKQQHWARQKVFLANHSHSLELHVCFLLIINRRHIYIYIYVLNAATLSRRHAMGDTIPYMGGKRDKGYVCMCATKVTITKL